MGNTGHTEKLKQAVSENIQRLVTEIKEQRKKLEVQEKMITDREERIATMAGQLAKLQGPQCWWDGKPCQRYSEIRGLQDCGSTCLGCSHIFLDEPRLVSVLERIGLAGILKVISLSDEKENEIQEEAKEETWQEIYEDIVGSMDQVGVEPVCTAD